MLTPKQQEVASEVFRKYVADDGLKPSADGMTAWEIAGIMLREAESAGKEEELQGRFEREETQRKFERMNEHENLEESEEADSRFPHEESAVV